MSNNQAKFAAPDVGDRATFQAELDVLRVREKALMREGDAIAAARPPPTIGIRGSVNKPPEGVTCIQPTSRSVYMAVMFPPSLPTWPQPVAKRRTRHPARERNHSEKRGSMRSIGIRSAESTETDRLAQLWHDGWQDAHADILPAELARYRTLESFRQRLRDDLASVHVVGSPDRPAGFCMIKQDELYQLYVSREARGTGVAIALLADAEDRLATAGVARAWLACAIGNARAMRFYEKHGWSRVGPMTSALETADGIFELEVWRYEKTILPHGA